MAIDKYCKAFTTKKLCSDILRKEFAGFGCLQLGAKIAAESTNAYIVIPGSCAYRLPLAVT